MQRRFTFTAVDWNLIADAVNDNALYNYIKDAIADLDEWDDPLTLTLNDDEVGAVLTAMDELGLSESGSL